jgi:aminopeptidase N
LIDMNFESIVAHELVHHWFGDLITCESWANLTLNEGFATYGQFLWEDFKYGKSAGEKELYKAKSKYLQDTPYKQIIRYHHEDSRELFDGHSYSKGALVLHQLRHHIGDEAFWEGLKYFLNKHAYQSVEIHDLRMAMEQVSGEDLNWFFNQWFLDKGHPILEVNSSQKNDTLVLNITQKQKSMGMENFKFPIPVRIYSNGKKIEKELYLSKEKENFYFPNVIEPELVVLDPQHVICAQIVQKLTPAQALFKYRNESHYASKINALQQISKDTTMASFDLLSEAVKDKEPDVRRLAMSEWAKIPDGKSEEFKEMLANIFLKDSVSAVRKSAINNLISNFPKDTVLIDLYKKAINDSSLQV